jgi:hypothetical protein
MFWTLLLCHRKCTIAVGSQIRDYWVFNKQGVLRLIETSVLLSYAITFPNRNGLPADVTYTSVQNEDLYPWLNLPDVLWRKDRPRTILTLWACVIKERSIVQTLSSDAWGTKPDIHGFTLVHAIPTIASVSFPKHRFAIKAWSYTLIACLHYFQLSAVNPFILHLLVTVCGPSLRPPSSVSAQSMHQTWPWHTPVDRQRK